MRFALALLGCVALSSAAFVPISKRDTSTDVKSILDNTNTTVQGFVDQLNTIVPAGSNPSLLDSVAINAALTPVFGQIQSFLKDTTIPDLVALAKAKGITGEPTPSASSAVASASASASATAGRRLAVRQTETVDQAVIAAEVAALVISLAAVIASLSVILADLPLLGPLLGNLLIALSPLLASVLVLVDALLTGVLVLVEQLLADLAGLPLVGQLLQNLVNGLDTLLQGLLGPIIVIPAPTIPAA